MDYEPECHAHNYLHQWRWPGVSQLLWWCHCWENVVHAIHLSAAETDGNQKVTNPDYAVGVVGYSSQDWPCAPWSSNGFGTWCYCVARERLYSLAWLWQFEPSAYLVLWCSSQSWWFISVPGNPEGSSLSYPKRQCSSFHPLRAASTLMGNSGCHSMDCCFGSR